MLTYIVRRILLLVPTLIGITFVIFIVMAMAPGQLQLPDFDEDGIDAEEAAALLAAHKARYGIDQPAPVQYLRWLNAISPLGYHLDLETGELSSQFGFKWPDLGRSRVIHRPVGDIILEKLPITVLLSLIATPFVYLVSITLGVYQAQKRGTLFDVGTGMFTLALWSIPVIWTGVLLVIYVTGQQHLGWFPTPNSQMATYEMRGAPFLPSFGDGRDVAIFFGAPLVSAVVLALLGHRWLRVPGALLFAVIGVVFAIVTVNVTGVMSEGFSRGYFLDFAMHLVLPVICLVYGGFAFLSKLTRASVLENILSDYARTARAKGLTENRILWRHVFRNSLLPLITVGASLFPSLLAGSVIVETIFEIDGMGKQMVDAAMNKDRDLVLSVALISGVLTLIGYLVADLGYAIADPRVSYD